MEQPFPNRNYGPPTSKYITALVADNKTGQCTDCYQSLPPVPPTACSGPSENRLKKFTLNPKDWLGLGLKGLICTSDKYTTEKYKNICNAVGPRYFALVPPHLSRQHRLLYAGIFWHAQWVQQGLSATSRIQISVHYIYISNSRLRADLVDFYNLTWILHVIVNALIKKSRIVQGVTSQQSWKFPLDARQDLLSQ